MAMKSALVIAIVFTAFVHDLAGANTAAPFNEKAVIPSKRRLQSLEEAHRILARQESTWKETVKSLPDPFFRDNFVPEETANPVEATSETSSDKSDLEVLRGISEQLQPTGTLEVGDSRYLLLDGKRLKVGDEIPLVFEGLIYRVTISSVQRNSYTLRLNDEELRREFK
jgi:hypothetical protein